MDGGFSYLAGEGVEVGTIVRVPLAGRIVRGFVVGPGQAKTRKLKQIRSISSPHPIFGKRLLETLRWAAAHYVAPLSVMLSRPAPPNLPQEIHSSSLPPVPRSERSVIPAVTEAALAGRKVRPHYLLGIEAWPEEITRLVATVLEAERSVMIIAPTSSEQAALAARLEQHLPERLIGVSPDSPRRQVTQAWSRIVKQPGLVLLGTPRVMFWPVAQLSLSVIIEEGRRAMKERQTPTLHVRDVLRRRAVVERFGRVYVGQVPTTETLADGVEVVRAPGRGRAWPLVEVVDRTEEPPGEGVLGERVRRAIRTAIGRAHRVFLFTHRHGYAPAARCADCRTLRVCPTCGARPDPGTVCRRCGSGLGPCEVCGGRRFIPLGAGVGRVTEEARRVVAEGDVGPEGPVVVGTERDLASAGPFDLTVAVDADGLVLGTNYRAGEEALRVLARLASVVARGHGRRMIVQTVQPGHPVIASLRRGDPLPFLRRELEERRQMVYPPIGELMVIEVRDAPPDFGHRLQEAVGGRSTLLGPAPRRGRLRWLVLGPDLGAAKKALRPVVQDARDQEARVRIDADPIDL